MKPVKRAIVGCSAVSGAVALVLLLVVWPTLRGWMVETRQKRAMADLRYWSSAVDAYHDKTGKLPSDAGTIDVALYDLLVPTYIQQPYLYDWWGHPIEYYRSDDGEHYQLISRGWKGEADLPPGFVVLAEPELTHCWEDDIILQDRELIRRPAGDQRGCTLNLLERFVTIPRHHERAQSEISARD